MIKQTELIDRYVYAVGRRLPYENRKDIEQEITTLIQDMLEERCGDRPVQEKDVRIVLTELGSPEELAGQYSPDQNKCLIGQPYYSKYKTVMKIVWPAVLFGMLVAGGIDIIISLTVTTGITPVQILMQILEWFANTVMGIICSFAVVTFIFAILHWKKVPLEELNAEHWENVSRPVRKKDKVSRGEAVCSIIFSIIFLIIFIFAPQIICAVFTGEDGTVVVMPVFDVMRMKELWYFTGAFALIGIVRDIYRLFEDKYTMKMVAVTGICDALSLLISVIWLTGHNIMNPNFIDKWCLSYQNENKILCEFFAHFQSFFLGILILALLLDFGDTLFRALRARKAT